MKKDFLFVLVFILGLNITSTALNNEKRSLEIKRVTKAPKIDGMLDDIAWKDVIPAKNFVQYEPYNGDKPLLPTEVKIVYDDHAIYFGAIMYDSSPDSIMRYMSERDEFRDQNSDQFSVILSTFNDGINAVEFVVSAVGVQSDRKHSGGHHPDSNWDAVWDSEVRITDFGWVVEMKIPYSALRFSKADIQNWGIQLSRNIRRYREWDTWNFIDVNVSGRINQMGEIYGIENIKPPLRLSLTPYVSAYFENNTEGNKWGNDFNAGMDLKWGINQSFTLDMILIPDFGQVQSDDEILNLSPYEIRYNEKRPFFTEGTELFNKGNIFYSRRIGSRPKGASDVYYQLNDNEIVISNPSETKLLNSTKISGRTDGGLGIGFLNAMTAATDAEITDTLTDKKRYYRTQGFTNYNMFVLDQTLKNNSYISFVNTNVIYTEGNYTANVTGGEFKFMNKENSYQIFGSGAISQQYTDSTDIGHKYSFKFSKTKGNFLFKVSHNTESDTYDPNDMGYIRQNNESSWDLELNYNKNEPFWKVLNWRNEISARYSSLYKPRKYTEFEVRFVTSTTFAKRYIHTGLFINLKPIEGVDYFEPRVDGWKFNTARRAYGNWWFSTDYRKILAGNIKISGWKALDYDRYGWSIGIGPRIRFSDKSLLTYDLKFDNKFNTYGYINDYLEGTNTVIDFGKRDQQTIINSLKTNYIFNNKMSLSLRVRHYWSRVEYDNYYRLQEDGTLSDALGYETYGSNMNYNYNAFTIDMKYLWRFAPGSEMSLVWKNSIHNSEREIVNNFINNFNNTLASSQINSISFKILYYLDYQYLIRNK